MRTASALTPLIEAAQDLVRHVDELLRIHHPASPVYAGALQHLVEAGDALKAVHEDLERT